MKKNILRVFLLILIIIWMYIVFSFSASNGDSSSSMSQGFLRLFINNDDLVILIEPVIRKIAHLSEYALGGFLIFGFFLTFNLKLKNKIIFSGLWRNFLCNNR